MEQKEDKWHKHCFSWARSKRAGEQLPSPSPAEREDEAGVNIQERRGPRCVNHKSNCVVEGGRNADQLIGGDMGRAQNVSCLV